MPRPVLLLVIFEQGDAASSDEQFWNYRKNSFGTLKLASEALRSRPSPRRTRSC